MHMADALISPAVGGAMWAATASLTAYSAKKLTKNLDEHKVPLMGVLGAFIFAAQMINFAIPATGSSGHLGGGMILAILLGPYAAFLVMASVLTVQALFFADGGLLALGCNIVNLGFFPCFIAYPLIYRRIAGSQPTRGRILVGAVAAAILGLQMGAFGVVLETWFSGLAELSFTFFLLLMQPIHLAIGIVEGLITAAVVTFVWKTHPDILTMNTHPEGARAHSHKALLIGLALFAVITGGVLSWFASTHPDGLEWAIKGVTGQEELASPQAGAHQALARVQKALSFLPDYDFKKPARGKAVEPQESRSEISAGKSLAGVLGASMTLLLAGIIGLGLRRYFTHAKTQRRKEKAQA
ncbi:MAG: energy-coupling factor ABC transporter permease [Deltaproteobacteria bacterium]|nr:energy-coupling factor ABC transporter permease [Deltaproteobacteria bacterium]